MRIRVLQTGGKPLLVLDRVALDAVERMVNWLDLNGIQEALPALVSAETIELPQVDGVERQAAADTDDAPAVWLDNEGDFWVRCPDGLYRSFVGQVGLTPGRLAVDYGRRVWPQ